MTPASLPFQVKLTGGIKGIFHRNHNQGTLDRNAFVQLKRKPTFRETFLHRTASSSPKARRKGRRRGRKLPVEESSESEPDPTGDLNDGRTPGRPVQSEPLKRANRVRIQEPAEKGQGLFTRVSSPQKGQHGLGLHPVARRHQRESQPRARTTSRTGAPPAGRRDVRVQAGADWTPPGNRGPAPARTAALPPDQTEPGRPAQQTPQRRPASKHVVLSRSPEEAHLLPSSGPGRQARGHGGGRGQEAGEGCVRLSQPLRQRLQQRGQLGQSGQHRLPAVTLAWRQAPGGGHTAAGDERPLWPEDGWNPL